MDEFIKQLAEEKKKQNKLIEDLIASPNYQAWGDNIKPTPEEEQKLYDYWSVQSVPDPVSGKIIERFHRLRGKSVI